MVKGDIMMTVYGIPLKYESYEFVAPCTTLTLIPASLIKKFEITVIIKMVAL